MTSRCSRTFCLPSKSMKFGSIGEMPPRTHGSFEFSLRIASEAQETIFEKICQPGSISKSQWDLLLGSFQIMIASTKYFLLSAKQGRAQAAFHERAPAAAYIRKLPAQGAPGS